MIDSATLGLLAGGLGLFLLGMKLMTEGLRIAAGASLRKILRAGTKTLWRGIFSGFAITALVQSSSAVTVATIGFVNAGLLTMVQALGVIYGSNIGTTMTGWLISLIGFKISVKALAMPLLGAGALLNLISKNSTRSAIGQTLAGFGLFFLGIDILKQAFEGMGQSLPLHDIAGDGMLGLLTFVGIGVLLTFLMQSSSATIAITLTATAGGMIPLPAGAAMVIGANVGTTSTALLAVIGATNNARRVAVAHVIFNIITGIVALILLPTMLWFLSSMTAWTGTQYDAAITLALFHTIFNVLGVILMLPLTPKLANYLNNLFTSEKSKKQDDVLQYLDKNIAETPVLAMDAMYLELMRTGKIATQAAAASISAELSSDTNIQHEHENLKQLITAIAHHAALINGKHISDSVAKRLPTALIVARYHEEMTALACDISVSRQALEPIEYAALAKGIDDFRQHCAQKLQICDYNNNNLPSYNQSRQDIKDIKQHYVTIKQQLLHAGVEKNIGIKAMVNWLDYLRLCFLLMQQCSKSAQQINVFMQWDEEDAEALQ
ncbi:MAG: Na/Pi cotransporter family protein [Mariprofundales bacterium]